MTLFSSVTICKFRFSFSVSVFSACDQCRVWASIFPVCYYTNGKCIFFKRFCLAVASLFKTRLNHNLSMYRKWYLGWDTYMFVRWKQTNRNFVSKNNRWFIGIQMTFHRGWLNMIHTRTIKFYFLGFVLIFRFDLMLKQTLVLSLLPEAWLAVLRI